jgi:NADPH-dependent 2,4-dienoyl-CoA reductase/sulfur reductase-like enzyme
MSLHVIIGAGQAGGYAAMAMREAGFAGRIVLLGEEALRPYERPPLSKEALVAAEAPPPAFFHSEARYAERAIELRLGMRVEGIDVAAGRLHLGSESLAYDRLLIATGGDARRLAVPGGERILYLRTREDAIRLRAALVPGSRVVCIGAGVIGLEIAASARKRGCDVAVVEAGPGPMGRSLSAPLAAWMAGLHERNGVALHFGAGVDRLDSTHVHCANGLSLTADVVVAGVGMVRATGLATAAGLAVENGILVDEFGRSSAAGIYAAGDVAAHWHRRMNRRLRQETWRHAMNHGIATGRAMAGIEEPYDDVPWFWTDQHGINLQVAGLAEGAVQTVLRGDMAGAAFCAFHLDAAGAVLCAEGVGATREVRAAMELIRLGKPVDPAALADPASNLQRLAAALKA